jgi:sulfotransferase family protein
LGVPGDPDLIVGGMLGFVIGTGRCGSTLVQEVLARHPEVGFVSNLEDKLPGLDLCGRWNNLLLRRAAPRDPRFGPFRDRPRLIERGRLRVAPSEGWQVLERQVSPIMTAPHRDLLASDLTPWLATRLERFFERRMAAQGRRVFLHHVTGWPRARLWQAAFPEARFIHVVRDGRAVANSCLQTSWWSGYQGPSGWHLGPLPQPYAEEWDASNGSFVLLAGLGWKLLMDAYASARDLVPADRWLDVRFEDVLADPRSCFKEMLAHMQLEEERSFVRALSGTRFAADRGEAFRQELGSAAVELLERSLSGHLRRWGYS